MKKILILLTVSMGIITSAAAADLEQDNICITVLPSPGLKLPTTPLTLAKQQLPLLSRTCLSRPGQDSVWRHLEHSVEAKQHGTGCIMHL